MTKVVHCKKEHYDVYIGRPSQWGNPFSIGKDGTREEVVQKFKAYITEKIAKNPELMLEIAKLKGKTLGCWCYPKACHGDVLKELAEQA